MNAARFLRANLAPCAGLIAPPLVWAIATELGQVLPYAECGAAFRPSLWASLVAVGVALVSSAVSWRAGSDLGPVSVYPTAHPFVRRLGAAFAVLFAFAFALQALASAILTGCER